jgi:ABC-type phosphate transport system substrate-binding protein
MANSISKLCLVAILLCATVPARAELVVVVNANSSVERLSRDEVINIFMGRYRKLPNGSTAQPLDNKGDTSERQDFYKKLLNKSLAEINAYWARLIFSGRTPPPAGMETTAQILARVAHDRSAISYVERADLNNQVKVVYSLVE